MYKYLKRLLDITTSSLLLIISSIPMFLIAGAIKLESEGPVIFKQVRTGKDGKPFILYKFRSMAKDNNVLNFKEENKPTKVGKFIRKTSLDELPQLLNVLKGDMSLIGPRPWIPEYYENFTDSQKARANVKLGITGFSQTIGRNNLSILEKIDHDIEYVNNYSFKTNLKIILMTIKTVFSKQGTSLSKTGIKNEIEILKEPYFEIVKNKKQVIKDKDKSIETEEYIPIHEEKAFNLTESNKEYEQKVDGIEDRLQPLEQQIATCLNTEKRMQLQNEATIYQFMLQDTLVENKNSLTKVLKK